MCIHDLRIWDLEESSQYHMISHDFQIWMSHEANRLYHSVKFVISRFRPVMKIFGDLQTEMSEKVCDIWIYRELYPSSKCMNSMYLLNLQTLLFKNHQLHHLI